MNILKENKDRFIDRNKNLTPEQKQEVKEFFNKYPTMESKAGDWQKSDDWTYEDFQKLFDQAKLSKTAIKKRAGIEGLVEGVDYTLLFDDGDVQAYRPLTHLGSYILASNRVGPKVWTPIPVWYTNNPIQDYTPKDPDKTKESDLWSGAKWCISMKHTTRYWDSYTEDKAFAFVFSEDRKMVPTGKVAITLWNVKDENPDRTRVEVFDADDDTCTSIAREINGNLEEPTYPALTRAYRALISDIWVSGEKYFERLKNDGLVVPAYKQGYYNIPHPENVFLERLKDEDGNLPFNIDIWNGSWTSNNAIPEYTPRRIKKNWVIKYLTGDLANAPEFVGGDIMINNESGLSSREISNTFENLVGFPQDVRGNISINYLAINSLEGLPRIIKRNLTVNNCKLKSLQGIEKVSGRLDVDHNELTSLEGPKKVGSLSARHNQITTLESMPECDGLCDVSFNPDLESLDGLNLTNNGFILHKKTKV